MSPSRFQECLSALGWSQRGLADALGRHEASIRQWVRGATRIPPEVATWLENAAEWHTKNPPPRKSAA